MHCVKTGIKFQIFPVAATYHGDMYYYEDLNCFLIRGLAPKTSPQKPHIILKEHIDTFNVIKTDSDFLRWWQEWNPSFNLLDKAIIIADSRF